MYGSRHIPYMEHMGLDTIHRSLSLRLNPVFVGYELPIKMSSIDQRFTNAMGQFTLVPGSSPQLVVMNFHPPRHWNQADSMDVAPIYHQSTEQKWPITIPWLIIRCPIKKIWHPPHMEVVAPWVSFSSPNSLGLSSCSPLKQLEMQCN